MKRILYIMPLVVLLLTLTTCRKTYEDGPQFSLRSKMNRITGKWRLVSMEGGVDRLNPEKDQYMELTKEPSPDGKGYIAHFTNFQEDFCIYGSPDSVGEALFTQTGKWNFFDGLFGGCGPSEALYRKEGLMLIIKRDNTMDVSEAWKIRRLKNKELIIKSSVCTDITCNYYFTDRTLTFRKE